MKIRLNKWVWGLAVVGAAMALAVAVWPDGASGPAAAQGGETATATATEPSTVTPIPTLCFTGDTSILTPQGSRRIDHLAVGDTVMSYNHSSGKLVESRIAALFSGGVASYLRVTLSDGTEIRVTEEHPFYDPRSDTYRAVRTFRAGEVLAQASSEGLVELSIVSIEAVDEAVAVYNLHVANENHNYVAAGVLVHNKTTTPTLTPTPTATATPTSTPTPEVDEFENSRAVVKVVSPFLPGGSQTVVVEGPTLVHVNLGSLGDGICAAANGREEVSTEIVSMTLTGISSLGPVTITESPTLASTGCIEESTNIVGGRLDLEGPDPPLAPPGECPGCTADSFFDVFVVITIDLPPSGPGPEDLEMHNGAAEPARVTAEQVGPGPVELGITFKPPDDPDDPDERTTEYKGEQPVPLRDKNDNLIPGTSIERENHIPNPPDADKEVLDIEFDDGDNYPDEGGPLFLGNVLDVRISQNKLISVTSVEYNDGPAFVHEAQVNFYADVPAGCEGRWKVDAQVNPSDTRSTFGDPFAPPFSPEQKGQFQDPAAPKEPGGFPGFESDLHFETEDYGIEEHVGLETEFLRFFELHCSEPSLHIFEFCNKIEPMDAKDPNLANNVRCETLFVFAGPHKLKDADPIEEGIQTTNNAWVVKDGCVNPEEGKGCLEIHAYLFGAYDEDSPNDLDDDPEGLGTWEEQIKFDHKIVKLTVDPNEALLESEGRIATCTHTVLTENWILVGCTSKDDPEEEGIQLGPDPVHGGLLETILVEPLVDDLKLRMRPSKDNGVLTDIIDENCEIADIYGEPYPDTLPGGLTQECGDAHITVRMLEGDMDLDCDVDVADDQMMAFRWGAVFGDIVYDSWFDLEPFPPAGPDFDIDIKDLQYVFGRNYSTCQNPIPEQPPQEPWQ